MTITRVSVNFNNAPGLLSNMTQDQLYKSHVAYGLLNMGWAEFSRITTSANTVTYNNNISESRAGLSGAGASAPLAAETETAKDHLVFS